MRIKLNGQDEFIPGPSSIAALVQQKNLQAERVVIEHNGKIIPQHDWPEILLQDTDRLEILSFVGGG